MDCCRESHIPPLLELDRPTLAAIVSKQRKRPVHKEEAVLGGPGFYYKNSALVFPPIARYLRSHLFYIFMLPSLVRSISIATMPKNSNSGIFMILSPAKTLDLESSIPAFVEDMTSEPNCSASNTACIRKILQGKSKTQLRNLLGISDKLADQAHAYWNEQHGLRRPAIFAFSGQAYQGLNISSLLSEHPEKKRIANYLQSHLRIIDPYYGSLRPFDSISPYRLEMATKNVLPDSKVKLAEYWKPSITDHLSVDLEKQPGSILLNLASDEYSAAVDFTRVPAVKAIFQDQGRVKAVHAKRARGLMTRFVAENNLTTLEDVKTFNMEGYMYDPSQSSNSVLVFNRQAKEKEPPKKRAKR